MKRPILIIHRSEHSSSVNVQRHVSVVREALGDKLDFCEWREPGARGLPDLTGRDVIKIGNSPFLGSVMFNYLKRKLRACRRAFVLCDDYTYPPATQVRQAIVGKPNVLMTNCPSLLEENRHLKRWSWAQSCQYINWNMASWKLEPFAKPTRDGLFYYGIFREDRIDSFCAFMQTNKYPVHLSARSKKALMKFSHFLSETGHDAASYGVLDFPDFRQHKLSLYIEDNHTHSSFHSLANRFYECLGLGIAMAFDARCVNTLKEAGVYEAARPWIVKDPADVKRLLPHWDAIRRRQRKLWAKDYRAQLVRDVRAMFKREGVC